MPLPDPQRSRAVLIGTAQYRDLPGLPAVAANIDRLQSLLTASDLWGLPPAHCQVLLNAQSPVEVLGFVHEAATAATDTLFVYYAGHGLRDPDNDELFLALAGSSKERLFTSIRYDDLRREIVQTASRVPSKVVMLDCCYSGAAMKGGMGAGDSADIADQARIEGTYLMTASASTVVALAPAGEEFTAFTGEIVDIFARGIPDGPDLLNMEKIYWHVRAELEAKRRPVPQQRAGNSGGMIALVRNRRGASDGSSQPTAPPRLLAEIPAGYEVVMHSSPQEILGRIDGLREGGQGDVAVRLIAAIATRRPAQEVASLVGLLRSFDRPTDIDLVQRALVTGPVDHIVELIGTLRDMDQPAEIDALLNAASCGPIQDLALLAQRLRDEGHPEESELLLNAALLARPSADATIALVGALWAADLGSEVERLLNGTAFAIGGDETLALAKALDSSGRAELAMTLYMKVLGLVVAQADEQIASLMRTARETQRTQDAAQLIDAALSMRSTADELLSLATALWAVDLGEDAERVLVKSAAVLGDDDLSFVAAKLRSIDRADAALRLYTSAAENRSASSMVGFVDHLRQLGRPVDANLLLANTVSWAVSKAAAVIAELLRSGGQADADRTSAAQRTRPFSEIVDLADQLELYCRNGGAELLLSGMQRRVSASDALQYAIALQQAGQSRLAAFAAAALIRGTPQGVDVFASALSSVDKPLALELVGGVKRLPARLALAVAGQLHQGGQDAVAVSILAAISLESVSKFIADVDEKEWPDGVRIFLDIRTNAPTVEIIREYKALQYPRDKKSADFFLGMVARHRRAAEIPKLLDTVLRDCNYDAFQRLIREIAEQRTPVDLATMIEAMPISVFGGHRHYSDLVDVVATRPTDEVEAIVTALNEASLSIEADLLVKRSRKKHRPV